MYDPVVHVSREQVATIGIAWVANAYAQGDRFNREQAMQEIQNELRAWKVQPERTTEILSSAATGYVDSEALRANVALESLVDAGADVERARAIRAAQH